mgnify:CR=1 FL=1
MTQTEDRQNPAFYALLVALLIMAVGIFAIRLLVVHL